MHLPRPDPKRPPRPSAMPANSVVGIVRIQPVQRPSQTVVIEVLGGDPWPQQPLDRLGGKELRHQIQPAITEPQPVEDHRHRCRADADPLVALLVLRVQPLPQPDLAADSRHDAQMIQPLRLVGFLSGSAHSCPQFALLTRLRLLLFSKKCQALVRKVGVTIEICDTCLWTLSRVTVESRPFSHVVLELSHGL